MLRAKGVLAILPQLKKSQAKQFTEELLQQGIQIYQAFPGAHRVKDQGVVAIGVRFIH
jgi:hypothetical protein